ncbi:MAG TPA: hypothetical protein VMU20_06480 [Candidatus Dormibacteraeota bacterium]|nr:hypothetical protein [Candidatus Dormibacteraeota bacterium]
MAPSITWAERGAPQVIEADEVLIAQLFTILAVAATRRARSAPQRGVAAWLAWHDLCVYGRDVERIALDEIPWNGDPEEKRAFLVDVVDSLEGRAWVGLFPVRPIVEKVEELIRRLRAALDVYDAAAPTAGNEEAVAAPTRPYGRCLLHVVPLHRYGCIVCNHDELYGALSGMQCMLVGKLLSATDPAERSEAARLLAVESINEPSRIAQCALAHVQSLAAEREEPGLLRTYLLSTIGVCARQAGDALDLRHVAPLAGMISVLDGWDAAQAHSILEAVEREESAAPLGDA